MEDNFFVGTENHVLLNTRSLIKIKSFFALEFAVCNRKFQANHTITYFLTIANHY